MCVIQRVKVDKTGSVRRLVSVRPTINRVKVNGRSHAYLSISLLLKLQEAEGGTESYTSNRRRRRKGQTCLSLSLEGDPGVGVVAAVDGTVASHRLLSLPRFLTSHRTNRPYLSKMSSISLRVISLFRFPMKSSVFGIAVLDCWFIVIIKSLKLKKFLYEKTIRI